jgi:hypothetical protein
MSVVEKVEEVATKSMFERPMYMGADRADALENDPEPQELTEEEVLDAVPEDTLSAEEVTYKKRYGDLRKGSNAEKDKLLKQIADLEASMEATPQWTPPKTDEELEAFKTEYPDTYDILTSVSHKGNAEVISKMEKLEKQLEDERAQHAEEVAMTVVTKSHPDWEEINDDEDFHVWVSTQSSRIQDGIYNNTNDGDFTSSILDLYKLHSGKDTGKANNTERKMSAKEAASKLVSGKKSSVDAVEDKPVFLESYIQHMAMDEYEAREAEFKLAADEGRILIGQ